MSEFIIRKFLASNLSFLDPDLTLVGEEYRLPNENGSSGYIDILARDIYDNFVIIEIKRSDQTARQAILEVYKYAGLLKQKFHILDAYIRIVIVSTEWKELLVPFSDFAKDSSYHVEGYWLTVDEEFQPRAKEKIEPLANPLPLQVIDSHLIYCYGTAASRRKGISVLGKRLKRLGAPSYVMVEMEPADDTPAYVYRYIAYLAIKREPLEYYSSLTNAMDLMQECDELRSQGCEDEEILRAVESRLLCLITKTNFPDELGTGDSEQFFSLINSGRWVVTKVHRNNFFSDDRIFDNERILRILMGDTGASEVTYLDFGSSKSKARLRTVFSHLKNLFSDQPNWLSAVEVIHKELSESDCDFEFTTTVYHPAESILWTLHRIRHFAKYHAATPLAYVPHFSINVIYFDQRQTQVVYLGTIKWNGQPVDSAAFFRQVLKGNMSMIATIRDLYPRFESKAMKGLNLFHSADRMILVSGSLVEEQPLLKHPAETAANDSHSLLDFIGHEFEALQMVDLFFDETSFVYP